MNKLCLVLMGPIMGNGGVIYHEGDQIVLTEATANLFASWGFVEILGDAAPEDPVAGRAAPSEETTPTEEATTTTKTTRTKVSG